MSTQQKILSELAMSRTMSTAAAGTSLTDARIESLANSMTEFHYDHESNLTFDNWYSRHEDTFRVDAGKLNDAAKTRLLLRKLSDSTHAEYMNQVLPKTTQDFSFDETVSKLKQLFSAHASLFCKRYRCLTLNKKASEDFQIYVCGLHAPQDAEIRTALLAKLEGNKSMTLNDLTTECHRIINLRKDASIVECPSEKASVNAINPIKHPKKSVVSKPAFKHSPTTNNPAHRNNSDSNNKPRTPCSKCGQLHYVRLDFIELFNLWHVPLSTVCNNVTTATGNVQWLKISFPQLFSDSLGCCNKTEAKLYVKPDVQPVFRGKRPVPFAALEPIETELKRLEELEIISPVEFSDWAAPIVAVRNKAVNGQPPRVRVCADYSTGLNSAIQPNQHPLPLPEEIFAKLSGSIVFSHIDLSDAYLQIPVDKDSRQYLTINTYRGLFEFNRLPPGVKSAPSTFQTIVDAMVAGLEGVETYFDDVLVHGKDAKEHRVRLLKLLERIQEWGFTLRIEKYSFFMPEIHYLGFIINHQGIRPDPIKTAAIYLLLAHYDPNLETIVAADAFSHGVGACLMHRYPDGSMKVVCHASRTVTPAEQRYGQVEKEALALIFGVTKFHRFIYGRKFSLHTDHKPILAMRTSYLGLIDPQAKPDDDFVIASVQMEEDVSATVNAALTALPVTFKHLQVATNKDKLLLEVIQHVQTGWPKSIKQVNNDLCPFYARKEGLSLGRGCLMLSGRIVVPKVYRQPVLKTIHKGHPGQERMKSVMRSHVYWPGVDQDVQNFVSSCSACASVAKSPPKTLLSSWPQTSHPWQRLHVDYAGPFEGQYFMVIVDSYRK
ncbi:uncharacterized protein K02A2.6-like [Sabethes cyaneus]|uniref:uncharacterized protein K02A2.6-like n=1 Tax=Sabethes cyaneus TaxID=53552 RepID=UPI00237DB739|nr:uncharacterized protein K02A2.6-like [Sabethes cyaneus]